MTTCPICGKAVPPNEAAAYANRHEDCAVEAAGYGRSNNFGVARASLQQMFGLRAEGQRAKMGGDGFDKN